MSARLTRNLWHADTQALLRMRNSPYNFSDTRWAAYENQDIGHQHCGHLQFLAVGPRNTVKTLLENLANVAGPGNWRYVLVGFVDLETGEVMLR